MLCYATLCYAVAGLPLRRALRVCRHAVRRAQARTAKEYYYYIHIYVLLIFIHRHAPPPRNISARGARARPLLVALVAGRRRYARCRVNTRLPCLRSSGAPR